VLATHAIIEGIKKARDLNLFKDGDITICIKMALKENGLKIIREKQG
jgi:hypothetical protein